MQIKLEILDNLTPCRPKAVSIGHLLFLGVTIHIASFGQTTPVNLGAPALQEHASEIQNNPPGPPLQQWLAEAQTSAASKGIPWKGLDITAGDEPDAGATTNLIVQYQKRTCQADAIVVGHTIAWLYHQSSAGAAVYGDYNFVIDTLLKDNLTAPIKSVAGIVVTRPGGDLLLPDGPVKYRSQAFPLLQLGISYLQFLRYIPASSGYRPLDSLSTLAATGDRWIITRKAFSGVALPGFTPGTLETSISQWLKSCN